MMFVSVTAFVAVALVGAGLVEGQSCKLTLQTDLNPKKEPLVLKVRKTDIRDGEEDDYNEVETLSIATPRVEGGDTGVIKLHNKEKLMIACAGSGNTIVGNGQDQSYLKCTNGKLTMDGQEITVDSTSCSKSYAQSTLKETGKTCGTGDYTGKVFEIGFLLKEKTWFPIIEACHNVTQGSTLYVSHTIVGKSLRGAVKCSDRRGFSRGLKTLYNGINPDRVFSKAGQQKAFKKILGASVFKSYVNETSFIARGHLAPDADFIFNSEQLATYYFVNAAPQWQDFNAGNWLVVENAVRDLAAKEELNLYVYTGTFGVLELPDSTNKKQPLYLAPDQENMVPVPKLFWKMVQHPITKSCTIAVSHNNVFLRNMPSPVCEPKTPDGWPELEDLSKGYTYYCDYEGFVQTVPYAPDVDCKDLFEFPAI